MKHLTPPDRDRISVPPEYDFHNLDSSSSTLARVPPTRAETTTSDAAKKSLEGAKIENEPVKPGIRNALTNASKQMPGSSSMKKIFYCWERFILAVSSRGSSGMDKAIGAEEERLGKPLSTEKKIEILFEQQELNEVLGKEGKAVKTLYKKLTNFDLPLYLNKEEKASLIEFCRALENKEMTSMAQIPKFINERLQTYPFINREGLKALKENCLKAQNDVSVLLVSNLKAKCLPELKNMQTKIHGNLSTIDEKISVNEQPKFKVDRETLDKAIVLLDKFNPSTFNPEQFVENYKIIESLSHSVANLEDKIKLVDENQAKVSETIGNLFEGMEKLGDRFVLQELKTVSPEVKNLFIDFQDIAGNELRIPIHFQIALLGFIKENPNEITQLKDLTLRIKKLKNESVRNLVNGNFSNSHEFYDITFDVKDLVQKLIDEQDKEKAEFTKNVNQFYIYLTGMAGFINSQILTDTLSDAVIFARGGNSFKEGPSSRTGNELANKDSKSRGLGHVKGEMLRDKFLHREAYGSATRVDWEILPEKGFKIQSDVKNTFQQRDLTFCSKKDFSLLLDYSDIFSALIPEGFPEPEVLNELFNLQEALRHGNLNRSELGAWESGPRRDPEFYATKQLKCIPQSLRSKISSDTKFWENIDRGQQVTITDDLKEKFAALVRPISVIEDLFFTQEKVLAGSLRSSSFNDIQDKGITDIFSAAGPLRKFVSTNPKVWQSNSPAALDEEEAARYKLIMTPIVEVARQADVELAKFFLLGCESTIDQPLDYLCHALDDVDNRAKKESFRKLINQCFEKGIQLSMPVQEMSLDQLEVLYLAVKESGDQQILNHIEEEFSKKIDLSLKNSSRKIRNACNHFKSVIKDDLSLKCEVFKALSNENGYKIFAGYAGADLFTLIGYWKYAHVIPEKENTLAAKRAEQQRIDAENTRKNIAGIYKNDAEKAKTLKKAKEEEGNRTIEDFSNDPVAFINKYYSQFETSFYQANERRYDLKGMKLSDMHLGHLVQLDKILKALIEKNPDLKDLKVIDLQVKRAFQDKLDSELNSHRSSDMKKAYAKLERLTKDLALKVLLLRDIVNDPNPYLKADINTEQNLKDFIDNQKKLRTLKAYQDNGFYGDFE